MVTPITTLTRCVALYCRISDDPRGEHEGVKAQERWGRAYAAAHWPGVRIRVYVDNNISAADENNYREGYEQLREAVRRGEVAHLWCAEQTRIERTETGWFVLAAELDAAGITELHTRRDGIVPVTSEVAGIKAVLAAAEVRRLKQRVNDRLQVLADEGRPQGGRIFGFRRAVEAGRKILLVDEREAAIIQECAERLLAGWSLEHLAKRLREAGVRGARGGQISAHGLRKVLTNPTVAGIRVHRGQELRAGAWPAILDTETRDAVLARLTSPRLVQTADGHTYPVSGARHASNSTARRYLLVGTAYCGVCENPLSASVRQMGNYRKPCYFCAPRNGGHSCVSIIGTELEEYVTTRLLTELDTPAFRAALAEDGHKAQRDAIAKALRASEARRRVLAARWGADQLTDEEWDEARASQKAREMELRAELAAIPPATTTVDVDAIIEGWDAMTLDERREYVHMFIEQVIISRALAYGLRRFDARRVDIRWRELRRGVASAPQP